MTQWCLAVPVLLTLLPAAAAPPPITPTTAATAANASPPCSLYEDSPVGVICLHADEVISAVATSETSWLVEFYSSWCGHCQHFAPVFKKLAEDLAGWSSVVQLGVIDCSVKENYLACNTYNIRGYPTFRFFHPNKFKPEAPEKVFKGARKIPELKKAILDHIESYEGPALPHWPHLSPIQGDHLLKIPEESWVPVALVFEEQASYAGREVILDMLVLKQLQVYRTLPENLPLVNHYSIMEFPSLVIETRKDDYLVVPGHSLADPRLEFREAIRKHFRNIPHTLPHHTTAQPVRPSPADGEGGDGEGGGGDPEAGRTPLRITRVSPVDLLGAVSYILRREVPLHSMVSGPAFTSLLRLTHLLESVLTEAYPAAVPSLTPLRVKLEVRLSAGFITNRDWVRLLDTKLDEALFPRSPNWKNCQGSLSHYRGYPCALWMLAHSLTILTLPVRHRDQLTQTALTPKMTFRSKDALIIVSKFIQNFFSCEHCREHFTDMSRTLATGCVLYDGDAVLWLWEAHNTVNRRLKNDISSDPLYPKLPFPSQKRCPYCYKKMLLDREQSPDSHTAEEPNWRNTGFRSRAESYLAQNATSLSEKRTTIAYTWNRTAVLLYMWNFYHWNRTHSTTQRDVLRAAWPKLFTSSPLPRGTVQGLGFSSFDMGLCVVNYVVCGAILLVVGYWLLRRRLRQYRGFLRP